MLHAFRVYGARQLDDAGVDDSVILRMGRWLRDAMHTAYLKFFKPEGSIVSHAHEDFVMYYFMLIFFLDD